MPRSSATSRGGSSVSASAGTAEDAAEGCAALRARPGTRSALRSVAEIGGFRVTVPGPGAGSGERILRFVLRCSAVSRQASRWRCQQPALPVGGRGRAGSGRTRPTRTRRRPRRPPTTREPSEETVLDELEVGTRAKRSSSSPRNRNGGSSPPSSPVVPAVVDLGNCPRICPRGGGAPGPLPSGYPICRHS